MITAIKKVNDNEYWVAPISKMNLSKMNFVCKIGSKLILVSLLSVATCLIPIHSDAAGLLVPKDGSKPALDIKDHNVKVVMEDGYAITTVTQIFHNPYLSDLEATYSFPVPEKASVSQFTMWIDGKPVHGEVMEKKKAQEVYEDQKSKGNEAGITEKDSYKTFDISVFPVRANQNVKIEIGYIQPAHIDTGMGRYVYPLEEGGVDEQKLAFWTANDKVQQNFSFDLILRSGYPVEGVRVPNQSGAEITQNGNEWKVYIGNNTDTPTQQILEGEIAGQTESMQTNAPVFTLDKDIVVYYRHAKNLPASVDLVTYKPDANKPGTFMMTVTPGMDLKPITEGRDWVFILDISGSMQGKYSSLVSGVSQSLNQMTSNDRFRIITFNNHANELTNGYVNATPENIGHYINAVKSISPNGSTDVYSGIEKAIENVDADRTSAMILVTDGVANVGVTEQKKFIELVNSKDIRLFTFIMGNSANRPLLEALTDASNGFAMNVSNNDDIIGKILLAKGRLGHQALHDAKIKISGVETSDISPEKIGSLYNGQQLIIFGHYVKGGAATVTLDGKISGEDKLYKTTFNFPETSKDNPEIERLWAYAKIESLMKEIENFGNNADIKQAVTDLGVEYGLVTDYTSMIVVRDEVYEQLGIDRKNRRRLENEFAAQQKRAADPIQQRRVDNSSLMFRNNRPSTDTIGGGGAIDPAVVLLLLPFLAAIAGLIKRRKINR